MADYKNIIFGTDFSTHAAEAFEEATYMGRITGATVHVIHIVPGSTATQAGESVDEEKARGKTRLAEQYPVEGGVYDVLHGHEADQIIKYADQLENPCIVIGARGIGIIVGLFGGGSICDKVVANAKCPVLVVPGG